MDKKVAVAVGIVAGIAGGTAITAAAIAVAKTVKKISREMDEDQNGCTFTSPDGNNSVTLTYGASASAQGLTRIKVVATTEGKEDSCTLVAFARKSPYMFESEWIDNNHFKLLIGATNRKQCCDVTFEGDKLTAIYYLCKVQKGQ